MPSKWFQVVNTDYINASLLTVSAVDRSYILTQGPLQVILFNQEKLPNILHFVLLLSIFRLPRATSGVWFGNDKVEQ